MKHERAEDFKKKRDELLQSLGAGGRSEKDLKVIAECRQKVKTALSGLRVTLDEVHRGAEAERQARSVGVIVPDEYRTAIGVSSRVDVSQDVTDGLLVRLRNASWWAIRRELSWMSPMRRLLVWLTSWKIERYLFFLVPVFIATYNILPTIVPPDTAPENYSAVVGCSSMVCTGVICIGALIFVTFYTLIFISPFEPFMYYQLHNTESANGGLVSVVLNLCNAVTTIVQSSLSFIAVPLIGFIFTFLHHEGSFFWCWLRASATIFIIASVVNLVLTWFVRNTVLPNVTLQDDEVLTAESSFDATALRVSYTREDQGRCTFAQKIQNEHYVLVSNRALQRA
jgi:hypothetical protein